MASEIEGNRQDDPRQVERRLGVIDDRNAIVAPGCGPLRLGWRMLSKRSLTKGGKLIFPFDSTSNLSYKFG
jgi:hypothetical protein